MWHSYIKNAHALLKKACTGRKAAPLTHTQLEHEHARHINTQRATAEFAQNIHTEPYKQTGTHTHTPFASVCRIVAPGSVDSVEILNILSVLYFVVRFDGYRFGGVMCRTVVQLVCVCLEANANRNEM